MNGSLPFLSGFCASVVVLLVKYLGTSCRALHRNIRVAASVFLVELVVRLSSTQRITVASNQYSGLEYASPLRPCRSLVLALVTARPDLTLEELRASASRPAAYGPAAPRSVRSSTTTRFREKPVTPAEQEPGRRRGARRVAAAPAVAEPERLVFIDETSATTTIARSHRRPRRGQRFVTTVPHGHSKTSTFPRRAAAGSDHRTVRLQQCHQRRTYPRLCRAGSRADAGTRATS